MTRDYEVVSRCSICGSASALLVWVEDVDESGEQRSAVRAEKVPHSAQACDEMQRLQREEWPTLW